MDAPTEEANRPDMAIELGSFIAVVLAVAIVLRLLVQHAPQIFASLKASFFY